MKKGTDMEQVSYSVRCAVLLDVIKKLTAKGSWCGETHVQKVVYVLQDLSNSNFGYKFMIYKHGPFSFELSEELSGMKASRMVDLVFRREDYGPSIRPTAFGEKVYETNGENIEPYSRLVDFVTEWFATKDVRQLEKIATAYFVTRKNPRDPAIERAKKICSLKPHVDMVEAEQAVRIVDQKRIEAARL